ncbi:MAG: hypothetical protein ACLQDL_04930 [Spirochaetia bacterium]
MEKFCAWCSRPLGKEQGEFQADDQPITHGICPDCLNFATHNVPSSLDDFLDRFPVPILAVDSKGVVLGCNKTAQRSVGKEPPQVRGLLGGEVMECAYARLPGGCGHTEHCAGCQIRLSVMRTHQTGESLRFVEAYLDKWTEVRANRYRLRITTEKVERLVLLRMDEMTALDGPAAKGEAEGHFSRRVVPSAEVASNADRPG